MKNKGFTLIELMIVMAIIGILAAVAVPMYQCKVNGLQCAIKPGEQSHSSQVPQDPPPPRMVSK